jgi:hypothetical protein
MKMQQRIASQRIASVLRTLKNTQERLELCKISHFEIDEQIRQIEKELQGNKVEENSNAG